MSDNNSNTRMTPMGDGRWFDPKANMVWNSPEWKAWTETQHSRAGAKPSSGPSWNDWKQGLLHGGFTVASKMPVFNYITAPLINKVTEGRRRVGNPTNPFADKYRSNISVNEFADPTGGANGYGFDTLRAVNNFANPLHNWGRAAQRAGEGRYRDAFGDLALGAFKVSTARNVTKAGSAAKFLAEPAWRQVATLAGTGLGVVPAAYNVGKSFFQGEEPNYESVIPDDLYTNPAYQPGYVDPASAVQERQAGSMTANAYQAPSVGGVSDLTSDQQAQMRGYANQQNRTDASGSSGMGGGRMFIDMRDWYMMNGETQAAAERRARETADARLLPEQLAEVEQWRKTGVNPNQPGQNVGLLPLTPEQLAQVEMQRLAAERAYEDLVNNSRTAKAQGEANYVSSTRDLQRQSVGGQIDLANAANAAGFSSSPAVMAAAMEAIQTPLTANSMASRKTLDSLLADIIKQDTQAKTSRDATLLRLKGDELAYREANTRAQQQQGYNTIGGR
jgi:hypothetical protein